MIQRIQTLFILAAGMLIGSLYLQKFADIIVNDQLHIFNAFGIFKDEELLFSGLPLMILIGIIAVLHLGGTVFIQKTDTSNPYSCIYNDTDAGAFRTVLLFHLRQFRGGESGL